MQYCFQYANQSRSVPGLQKNSNSICSNSLVRNVKLPGVISLRKDLPICPIPNGTFFLDVLCTFLKFTKIPCAVSGLKINCILRVLGNALKCLEHQVELTDICEVMLSAARDTGSGYHRCTSSSAPGSSRRSESPAQCLSLPCSPR